MSLFEKLAAQEEQFFETEFFSPVLRGNPVRVKIAGVLVSLKVRPKNFEGWGVFKSKDQKVARYIREPSMGQRQQYLDLFPRFIFVACRQGKKVYGIPAMRDDRIVIQGQVPIALPNEVRLFDTIDVRFDGSTFWYDRPSTFRTARVAAELRDMFAEETEPDQVSVAGMTVEEKLAYQIAFDQEIESKKDRKEERLKKALERGGATLRSYVERGNTYTVEFTVDGERHRSVVDVETLRVASAGICLTDHQTGRAGDSDFDLQSLVGVIREGQNRDLIYRVGVGR